MSSGEPDAVRFLDVRRGREEIWSEEAVAVERPLEVRVNGRSFSVTMCSPGAEDLLARGLLYTEGVLADEVWYPQQEQAKTCTLAAHIRDVAAPPAAVAWPAQERRLAATASCGLCGAGSLAGIEHGLARRVHPAPLAASAVPERFAAMAAAQGAFGACGGTHAAGAFTAAGECLRVHEDIGRHNAVDKVVGGLIADARLAEAELLTVSGRISFEIVAKALRAGFAAVAAVSAPSSLAVDLARRSGMLLLAFCRDDRFTIYSGAEHVASRDGMDVRTVA